VTRPAPAWWQGAAFYQIYPRSFCLADPEGRAARLGVASPAGAGAGGGAGGAAGAGPDLVRDGSGDLEGIRRHLDHLVWLGVDAVWLSPFYPSPMRDFGYDVADYCDVDPLFGTLDDFDRLLAEAHERGLRVIVDFVPNHTSDLHPWFLDARTSRTARHRDWYVWRDPDPAEPGRPPNNWRRAFGDGPAWTFDEATGQWYLHLFLPEQPDLDWSNPEVREAMRAVMAFWLERGVDGFRIDVVHALGKDPALRDAPTSAAALPWSALNDDERTHPILRELRAFVDSFPSHPVVVGEVFLISTETIARYYGSGDELHLAFNFPLMFCPFDAGCFRRRLAEAERHLDPIGAWPAWVLSSHDRPRAATRFGGSERRARAAAVLLLGMRGTPFLYAGEELGLEDADVPADRVVDPGGRDGCRAPIPWDAGAVHGWEVPRPEATWLPFPPSSAVRSVASQQADRSSVLWLYRDLLGLRRSEPSLRVGSSSLLDAPDGVVAVLRSPAGSGDGSGSGSAEVAARFVVAVNFLGVPVDFALPGGGAGAGEVALSSGAEGSLSRAGDAYGGVLGPEEAVVVRLATA